MTNSPEARLASQTLRRIFEQRDDASFTQTAGRIDDAVRSLSLGNISGLSHARFHRIVGAFTRHVYRRCLTVPHFLSMAQAQAEGLHLLDQAYFDGETRGHEVALMHANRYGIERVLQSMAEAVKQDEQAKLNHAVFVRCLTGCPWIIRCQIAKELLDAENEFIPAELQWTPERLADEIPALIDMIQSTNNQLGAMVNTSKGRTPA